MVRSFQNFRAIDPGFDAASALTFRIGLPDRDYPDRRRGGRRASRRFSIGWRRLPGVTAVSATTCLPLDGMLLRQLDLRRTSARRSRSGRAAGRRASAPSPAATSRRWACGCCAAAASTATMSSAASPTSSSTRRWPTRYFPESGSDRPAHRLVPAADAAARRPGSPSWASSANTPTTALGRATSRPKLLHADVASPAGRPFRATDLVGPDVIDDELRRPNPATPPLGLAPSVRRASMRSIEPRCGRRPDAADDRSIGRRRRWRSRWCCSRSPPSSRCCSA